MQIGFALCRHPGCPGFNFLKACKAQDKHERICLLFGTSITSGIVGDKLSRRNRTVVNISYSGSKIADISEAVNEFYMDNPDAVQRVDKIILSFGTNEMKYFNSFENSVSKRYYNPICNLVTQVKYLFPVAQIYFQSLLPIRIVFKYNAKSIHSFNYLLIDVCRKFGYAFINCFGDFLDESPSIDIDLDLYRDTWSRTLYYVHREDTALNSKIS